MAPVLAVDQTGQTIYVISASGLTVLRLPTPLDQMSPMQWPLTVHSSNERAGINGTLASRIAAMHSKSQK